MRIKYFNHLTTLIIRQQNRKYNATAVHQKTQSEPGSVQEIVMAV